MHDYTQEMELYFNLKDTPASSRESYSRRIKAFIEYIQSKNKALEDITLRDVQQYILYLKQEKVLSAGSINNYVSSVRFFYTHVLNKEWNKREIPRMRRVHKLPVLPPCKEGFTSNLRFLHNTHSVNLLTLWHKALGTQYPQGYALGGYSNRSFMVNIPGVRIYIIIPISMW